MVCDGGIPCGDVTNDDLIRLVNGFMLDENYLPNNEMAEVSGYRLVFCVSDAAQKARFAREYEIVDETRFRAPDGGPNAVIIGRYIPQFKLTNPIYIGQSYVVAVRLIFNGLQDSTFAWADITVENQK